MATVKNRSKSNNFHQLLELHLDCGSEVLRRILITKLELCSHTLQEYLNIEAVRERIKKAKQKGHIFEEQFKLLYPVPKLCEFDITLLTFLLLEGDFNSSVTGVEKKAVKKLRKERNHMSHVPKAELDNKQKFDEVKRIILELANCVSKEFEKEIKQTISILEKKEFVSCRSMLDIVRIRNEELLDSLLTARPLSVNKSDTIHLKFGLTKWTKQFSRTIDINRFLLTLKEEGVITQVEKLDVEKEYNKDEQSGKLIMMMVDQTNENIWKFCRCLRRVDENLANLVENQNIDGIDIDHNIQKLEEGRIRKVLETFFVKDETGNIQSEKIHILVERELGYSVGFAVILQIATDIFNLDEKNCTRSNLQGMSWNDDEVKEANPGWNFENAIGDESDDRQKSIIEMSPDDFIKFIEYQFNTVKGGFGAHMKTAFEDHCISPEGLLDLTDTDLKLFETYMPKGVIPIGITKKLEALQKQVKKESARKSPETNIKLREFDSTRETKYSYGLVRPPDGNLLIPAHAFRTLPMLLSPQYIVRECIQFIAACMNTRKNGTIHFGIQTKGQGCGFITGIKRPSVESLELLDFEIHKSLDSCFESEQRPCLKGCVRPIQVVPVNDDAVVIELDVVPHSEYTQQSVFRTRFPPKGVQENRLFVLRDKNPYDVFPVPEKDEKEVIQLYAENFKMRKFFDTKHLSCKDQQKSLAVKLVETLTSGYSYVTDQYIPIICTGKITGHEHEDELRQQFDVPEVFLSSPAVFDFDPATDLRKKVEKQDTVFRVLTTEQNASTDSNALTAADRIWMYCNGNNDLGIEEMVTREWYQHRFHIVKDVIEVCRQKAPRRRAMVIFFVFSKSNGKDPLLEMAEECFKSHFKDNCRVVVIAESNEMVSKLKSNLVDVLPSQDAINESFHAGIVWSEISEIMKTIFQTSSKPGCKLPKSNGHCVIMTAEEKRNMKFTDIDIVGGEECLEEDRLLNDEQRDNWKEKEKHKFYRGEDVSWWNFYYEDQVQNRDVHGKYMKIINEKIAKERDAKIETVHVCHQPGAGGSTTGRYLIWKLSQFEEGPKKAFRCCVVKHITENTASQITNFMFFKETHIPNPVIILTDNETVENLRLLETSLNFQAYHRGDAKNLFCLHIAVSRVPVSFFETGEDREPILKHELSPKESNWFKSKYMELTKSKIDVNTLIAFNVMRHNFDIQYIKELAERMIVSVNKSEMGVLKCLSLIDSFDTDNRVPISALDCLMAPELQTNADGSVDVMAYKGRGPRGLVVPYMKKHHTSTECRIWNVAITDALSLLIKRGSDKVVINGITIISQALADAILDYIMSHESLTLHDVTDFVLNIVSKHVNEKNLESKHFVEIVNSLFKTRQVMTDEGEIKSQFSKLVVDLKAETSCEEVDANKRVVTLMKKCFHITKDAMVGQQLARFLYIHMNDFVGAECVIEEAIQLQQQNSYLFDTHGQIYRSKLENEIGQKGEMISNDDAIAIIKIAFTAIGKFVEGQEFALQEKEGEINDNCFYMEIKMALYLLENFKKFVCYKKRPDLFLEYLNNPEFDVKGTPLEVIETECQLERLKKNHPFQIHIADTLRQVEERNYQVRKRLYTFYTGDNEKLLLRLREEFERFYGNIEELSKFQFQYGIGLKSLMQAYEIGKDKEKLIKRVKEADENLQRDFADNRLQQIDKRDLLVFLGYELIQMSNTKTQNIEMPREKYQMLLRYCDKLLEIERKCSRYSRPYLEAYLFFAILQWPTIPRIDTERLCTPTAYKNMLKEWETQFHKNFRTGREKQDKAKNYFALGQGTLGCDVVDLECIRKEWTDMKATTEKRKKRRPVYGDNFWREPFVTRRLERLSGRADDSGRAIEYEIKHKIWDYKFSIKTYYPYPHLSNRRVTFVLGFSWANLRAFDVEDYDKCPGNGYSKKNPKSKENKVHGSGAPSRDTGFSKETHTPEGNTDETEGQQEGSDGGELPATETQNISFESDDDFNVKDDDSDAFLLRLQPNKSTERKSATRKKEIKQTETPVGETMGQTYDESLHGGFGGLISDQELQQPKNTVGGTQENFDDSHLGAVGGASLHPGSSHELVSVVDVRGSPSAKQKNPVEMLNDIMKEKYGLKHVDYQQTSKTGGFAFWVCIEKLIYEGKGSSKKLARHDTARNALRDHFNIHLEPSGPEGIAATKDTERSMPQNRKSTKHKSCQKRKKRT